MEKKQPVVHANQDAERSVLGAILLTSGKALLHVADVLAPDDFYHPGHRAVYQAMHVLDKASQPIDAITVRHQLQLLGTLQQVASLGADFLDTVTADVVSVTNVGYHARAIAQAATMRRLGATLVELTSRLYSGTVDHDEMLEEAERRFLAVSRNARDRSQLVGVRATATELINEVHARALDRDKDISARAIPSGLYAVDRVTRGFHPGDYVIIGGRPSSGKSALAGNIAESASYTGAGVLIFSLEMSAKSLFERMVSSNGIQADRLRSGRMEIADFTKLQTVASRLADPERIWIDDATGVGALSITQIRSRARRWRMNQGAQFDRFAIVVDYLQLVLGSKKNYATRQDEVSEVSRGLKALSKELNCTVIALSQINRAREDKADKRPTNAQLRESGQIEQDADVILLLYRDELENEDSKDRGVAELNVSKNRNGLIGMVKIAWDPRITKFSDLKPHYPPVRLVDDKI